jgi:hypothetical protein
MMNALRKKIAMATSPKKNGKNGMSHCDRRRDFCTVVKRWDGKSEDEEEEVIIIRREKDKERRRKKIPVSGMPPVAHRNEPRAYR